MGVSGGNFAVADTGTLVLVENEGNAGLSTAAPPVHVALLGIEKMLPRLEHLPVFLNLLARSGTGQKLTTYTHLIHGPSEGQQLYVILLDNGRTSVLEDPAAWKALACIRCGACLNACPVYRRVGGWAYGWVYPGPIGSILTPHLVGLAKAGELPFASSLCGACGEVCPVKIDIPHQLVHLRHRAVNEPSPMRSAERAADVDPLGLGDGRPGGYKLTMWAVRLGVRIAPICPGIPASLGPGPAAAICRSPPARRSESGGRKGKLKGEGMKRIRSIAICIAIASVALALFGADGERHNVKPRDGYVPDAETAIAVAIAVWNPIYGKKQIEEERPYTARLEDGVWTVKGSLPKSGRTAAWP